MTFLDKKKIWKKYSSYFFILMVLSCGEGAPSKTAPESLQPATATSEAELESIISTQFEPVVGNLEEKIFKLEKIGISVPTEEVVNMASQNLTIEERLAALEEKLEQLEDRLLILKEEREK